MSGRVTRGVISWLRIRPLVWLILVISLLLVALALASILFFPAFLHPPLSDAELDGVPPGKRVELQQSQGMLQNEAMGILLQGVGALLLLSSAGLGAYLTGRQLRVSKEGQITERFAQAVDQLGNKQIDIRLGGIYALARIAKDSPSDQSTIAEILAAYVRNHASHVAVDGDESTRRDEPQLGTPAPDVQAIMTLLGREDLWREAPQLTLSGVDLRKGNLERAHLPGANLGGASLQGAYLCGVNLQRADLVDAQLQGAYLSEACLQEAWFMGASLQEAHLEDVNARKAYFWNADLQRAHLPRADLQEAYLDGANLSGAFLGGANLRGARLRGANLKGAYLDGADLRGAQADALTIWPDHLDHDERRRKGVYTTGKRTCPAHSENSEDSTGAAADWDDPRSDADLLKAIAEGDQTAFKALYDRYAGWVLGRLQHRCPDPSVAQEVMQDTFAAIWQSAAHWAGRGDVAARIWGLAIRRLLDTQRRLTTIRRATLREFFARKMSPSAREHVPDLSGVHYSCLAEALRRLPPELLDVMRLCWFDGFTTREAATLLGISHRTVKTRLKRAREELRERLDEIFDELAR